jgi:hypothetical protein
MWRWCSGFVGGCGGYCSGLDGRGSHYVGCHKGITKCRKIIPGFNAQFMILVQMQVQHEIVSSISQDAGCAKACQRHNNMQGAKLLS